jgi:hypothetical protein
MTNNAPERSATALAAEAESISGTGVTLAIANPAAPTKSINIPIDFTIFPPWKDFRTS